MFKLLNLVFIGSLFVNVVLAVGLQKRQDLTGLPGCGQSCLVTSLTTNTGGCSQTDFACLCKSETFLTASTKCYGTDCSVTDSAAATAWGVKTCASIGITIPTSVISSTNYSNVTNSSNNTGNIVPINSNNSSTAGSSAKSIGSIVSAPPFEMMLFFLTILISY